MTAPRAFANCNWHFVTFLEAKQLIHCQLNQWQKCMKQKEKKPKNK